MQTSQSKVLTPTTSPVAFYTLATFPCSNHQCQIPDNQGQPLCPRANFPRACRNQNKESCSFLCPLCLLADPGISPCGPAWHGPLVSRHVWILKKTSWQSFLCLHVLPYLMKANLNILNAVFYFTVWSISISQMWSSTHTWPLAWSPNRLDFS